MTQLTKHQEAIVLRLRTGTGMVTCEGYNTYSTAGANHRDRIYFTRRTLECLVKKGIVGRVDFPGVRTWGLLCPAK